MAKKIATRSGVKKQDARKHSAKHDSAENDSAKNNSAEAWAKLNRSIVRCRRCPRLVEHCRDVAVKKRKSYLNEKYHGKPVENFGAANSDLLIVGLAPGAHGANRTGRMFTGDRSGDWLYRAMFRAGFANQAESNSCDDGLQLNNAAVTNVCLCAPPDNKPTKEEIQNCRRFLNRTVKLAQPRVFLAFGAIGWRAVIDLAIENNWLDNPRPLPRFSHGAKLKLSTRDRQSAKSNANSGRPGKRAIDGAIQLEHNPTWLVGCYHPSQQNTFTGRLTEKMLDNVFRQVKRIIAA